MVECHGYDLSTSVSAANLRRIVMTTGLVPQRPIGIRESVVCIEKLPLFCLLRMRIQKRQWIWLFSYLRSYHCVLSSCTMEHAFQSRRRELVRQARWTWQQKTSNDQQVEDERSFFDPWDFKQMRSWDILRTFGRTLLLDGCMHWCMNLFWKDNGWHIAFERNKLIKCDDRLVMLSN